MDLVVKTRQGEVRGRVADGVYVFKGIPYAAPPFGAESAPAAAAGRAVERCARRPHLRRRSRPSSPYPPPIDRDHPGAGRRRARTA